MVCFPSILILFFKLKKHFFLSNLAQKIVFFLLPKPIIVVAKLKSVSFRSYVLVFTDKHLYCMKTILRLTIYLGYTSAP